MTDILTQAEQYLNSINIVDQLINKVYELTEDAPDSDFLARVQMIAERRGFSLENEIYDLTEFTGL